MWKTGNGITFNYRISDRLLFYLFMFCVLSEKVIEQCYVCLKTDKYSEKNELQGFSRKGEIEMEESSPRSKGNSSLQERKKRKSNNVGNIRNNRSN